MAEEDSEGVAGFGVRISNSLLQWLVGQSSGESEPVPEDTKEADDVEEVVVITEIADQAADDLKGQVLEKVVREAEKIVADQDDSAEREELKRLDELFGEFTTLTSSTLEENLPAESCVKEHEACLKCTADYPNDVLRCASTLQAYSDCAMKASTKV